MGNRKRLQNMILYAIHYKGPVTNYNWSIISIYKTPEQADIELSKIIKNHEQNNLEIPELEIILLDTDSDLIYDCSEWE